MTNEMVKWDRTKQFMVGGYLFRDTEDGDKELITSTAPTVLDHACDFETGTYYTTVAMENMAGEFVARTFDNRDLLSEERILDTLASIGAAITSANAPLVLRRINDLVNDDDKKPFVPASTHLGWVEGSERSFLPWRCDGTHLVVPDGMERIARAFEPSGTPNDWAKEFLGPRRQSMGLRAMLAASAAAPLVRMLGLRPLMVYLWHGESMTMDAPLRDAGSVWGDAGTGAGYLLPFVPPTDETMRVASFLRNVPYLQGNLLVRADEGNTAAIRRATGWALALTNGDVHTPAAAVTLATGEIPLIGSSNWSLLRTRVLEINDNPVEDLRLATSMDDAAHRFHGTVGKRIANILTECGREGTRSMWEAAYERLGPLVHNDWSREMIVLVCLGDILVRRAAFFMGETIPWDDVLWEAECLCRWLRTSTIPEGDYYADQFFYRDLAGWIKKNYAAFTTYEADVVDIERTPGYFTDGRRKSLVVPRSTLESLIPDQYDPIRTLYRLGDIRTISESPRPSFDNSTDRDPGNDWMRIDVEAVC